MKIAQRLLFLSFIFSNTIRTTLNCFALDQLIKVLGANQLGIYYGYAALLSMIAIITLTLLPRKISSTYRFFVLHSLFIIIATICLFASNVMMQTKILFLANMGLGIIIYFENWSLAATLITPFESRRIFPLLGTATQIGVFAGALIAMAAHFGLTPENYYMLWLVGEILILMSAIPIFISPKNNQQPLQTDSSKTSSPSFLELLRHYQLVPRISFWVFLWGLLIYSISTLTGQTFDRMPINLTMFYGMLTLVFAVLTMIFSTFIYPKLVKWVGLGAILFLSSIIAFTVGGIYLFFDFFAIAIVAIITFEIIDGGLVTPALSVKFGLYPSSHRDRLRLLAEILAMTAGEACVALLFIAPAYLLHWLMVLLFIIFVAVGFLCYKRFIGEILNFLHSKNTEEANNAVALYDMLEIKEGYNKLLHSLEEDDLSLQINILNTFANLQTIKPAASILKLFEKTKLDPLRIAILRYFEQTCFPTLDPFIQYQLLDNLKRICRAQASNNLRSLAIKLLIQNGSADVTVSFIINALSDKDDRVVANAIEGLNYVNYPGIVPLLKPFLQSPIPRIRANCMMTLWKYDEIKNETVMNLSAMLHSNNTNEIISGIYAVGEIKDASRIEYLIQSLASNKKEIVRGTIIALLKLGHEAVYLKAVEIILGEDEPQALNFCYLSLRLEERILNELIIAHICSLGEIQKQLAYQRYAACGGFCRLQLSLLSDQKILTPLVLA